MVKPKTRVAHASKDGARVVPLHRNRRRARRRSRAAYFIGAFLTVALFAAAFDRIANAIADKQYIEAALIFDALCACIYALAWLTDGAATYYNTTEWVRRGYHQHFRIGPWSYNEHADNFGRYYYHKHKHGTIPFHRYIYLRTFHD